MKSDKNANVKRQKTIQQKQNSSTPVNFWQLKYWRQ